MYTQNNSITLHRRQSAHIRQYPSE